MFPRAHVILGAAFIALLWLLVPNMSIFYLALVFLASFLIDFDHYAVAVFKTKKLSLNHAFDYHKYKRLEEMSDLIRGIKRKSDFHLFHTVEFHAIIGLLGILWIGFFYIFIGMVFHSLVDLFSLLFTGVFHRREYFLFNWIRKRAK